MAEVISFVAGFLVAWAIIIWLNSKHIRQARKRESRKLKKSRKKVQATKVIVFSIMLTYHLAFILGAWVVILRTFTRLPRS